LKISRSRDRKIIFVAHTNFFLFLFYFSVQLIVGPQSWATKVLRPTIGERFMLKLIVRVFIDASDRARSEILHHIDLSNIVRAPRYAL